ncbi:MAG: hypothetical protein HQL08_07040 [Nitrospirae bacterium]|nr:hypothetical protein [Nitrospirota bacterium]
MRVKIIFISLVWLMFFVIPVYAGAEEATHKQVQTIVVSSEDEFYDLIDKGRVPHFSYMDDITATVSAVFANQDRLVNSLKESAGEKNAEILVITQIVQKAHAVAALFFGNLAQVLEGRGFILKFKEPVRENLIEQIKNYQTNNVFETYSALHYLDKQLLPEDRTLLDDVAHKCHYPALSEIAFAELSKLNQDVSQNNDKQQAQNNAKPNEQAQTVKIKSKYNTVDLKSEPSPGASVIEHVPGGMEVLKISENAKFVQIRLDMDDGSQLEGWISKEMVDDSHPQEQTQTVKIKAKYKTIALKSEPSIKASVIEHVPGGMEVLKISENNEWLQIRLDMEDGSQLEGWISKKMVE